jgi:hypothetical protein
MPREQLANAGLGPDLARVNLLTNGGFEIWQRTVAAVTLYGSTSADRWAVYPSGTDTMSVTRQTAGTPDVGSAACIGCVFVLGSGGGGSLLSQILKAIDGYQFASKTISLSMRVRCSTANAVRVSILDATNGVYAYSAFHSGSGLYETLTVTATLGATCAVTYVSAQFSASCTAYLDNAMLVPGAVAADYAPLHPTDELARCLRYYEVLGENSATELCIRGYLSIGGMSMSASWFYRAQKAVAPTVTKVGTWQVGNTGQPTISSSGKNSMRVDVSALAAGDTYALNQAGCYVTVEANP